MLELRHLPLLLPLLLCSSSALDPFAMFESETPPPPPSGGACCSDLARCRRLLDSLGPLRARWAGRPRCAAPRRGQSPDRAELNSAFMQRHVARTLKLLRLGENVPPAERETFLLRARITETQVLRLRQFLSGAGDLPLVEIDAILEEVLAESELESLLVEGRPRWLRRLTSLLPAVSPELIPLLLTSALTCWLVAALLLGRSWSYVISRLSVLMLVVSFFWHWNHLYKRAQAERHLQFNAPQGCEAGDRGWTDGLLHYLRGMVSFVKPDDVCREYYAKLHVDPFTEVSPGLAMMETLTQMVLHPAEQFGRALGRFYGALAAEVPTLWLVPLIVISLVFILALVIIACRCIPSSSNPHRVSSVEPQHVTITPGSDTIYLVVTADGEIQPVGEQAKRRTSVQRAGPERVSWLAWTGRGLVRSVSAGALAAGGAVSAGTRALMNRRTPAPSAARVAAVMETEQEETESPSISRSPSRDPRQLARREGEYDEDGSETCSAAKVQPPAASGLGGGDSGVEKGAGDRKAIDEIIADRSPQGPSKSTAAANTAAGDASSELATTRVTSTEAAVTSRITAGGGDADSPVVDGRRPAEVAPRGGGDENRELATSPFLTRIKEVMDTSLEEKDG